MPQKRFGIKWNGIPHTDLSLPQGKWRFDDDNAFGAMIFQMVHTSREMGITVSEFLQLPRDEKAIQIAYSNIISKMEAVNAQEREDDLRRQSQKAKRK
ncbi:MAG: hypothetical protein CSB13_01745 [Chloroflexi bacterium]|nr:MAG: hypothetical protein CSB13_01745 [Chloroflexota bacterium]